MIELSLVRILISKKCKSQYWSLVKQTKLNFYIAICDSQRFTACCVWSVMNEIFILLCHENWFLNSGFFKEVLCGFLLQFQWRKLRESNTFKYRCESCMPLSFKWTIIWNICVKAEQSHNVNPLLISMFCSI